MPNTITVIATPSFYVYTTPETVLVQATVADENGAPVNSVPVTFTFSSDTALPTLPVTETVNTGVDGIALASEFNIGIRPEGYVVQATATIAGGISDSTFIAAYTPSLPQVFVTNAFDNIIDQYSINAGIQSTVPAGITLAPNQIYTFYWGEQRRQRVTDVNDAGQVIGVPWVINIKTSFPNASVLSNGVYNVFYSVRSQTGNTSVSLPRTITVQGSATSPATLLAPVLLPTTLNNLINLNAAFNNPSIFIPAQAALIAGSTYNVTLVATPRAPGALVPINRTIGTGPVPATAANDGIDVPMTYASGILLGIEDSDGDFYYTITPTSGPVGTSRHLATEIDTVAPFA